MHAVTLAIWLAVVVGIAAIWAFPRFFGALLLMALAVALYGVLYAIVEQRMLRMDRDFVDELGSSLRDLDDEEDEEDEDELDRPRPAPRPRRAARRRRVAAPASPGAAPAPTAAPAPMALETSPAATPVTASDVPPPAADGTGST